MIPWVDESDTEIETKPYPGINRYRPAELTQLAFELIYGSVYHCLNTWDSRFDHSFQVLQVTSIGVSYYALCLILEFRMKQMCCTTQKHVELMSERSNLIQVAFDYLGSTEAQSPSCLNKYLR